MRRLTVLGLPLLLGLATFGGAYSGPAIGGEEAQRPRHVSRGDGPFGAFPSRDVTGDSLEEEALEEERPVDQAIGDALRWLVAHQSPDGSWEASGFYKWCDGKPADEEPDGLGKATYDVGVTGLALSVFLAAGYTTRGRHPFSRTVASGIRYLKNMQDLEGCFGKRTSRYYIYNHGAAALALVEIYGMTGSPIHLRAAQRGLDFIRLARNPFFAWRYGVKPGDNDTSVAGWMTLPLHAARVINDHAKARGKPPPLEIDEGAFDGVGAWVDNMTHAETGRVGYIQRGGASARPQELIDRFPGDLTESMTAVGILIRRITGIEAHDVALVEKGVALIEKRPPTWNPTDGSIDMYFWHFATLALHQVGGDAWESWREAYEATVLHQQRKDSTYCLYKGSWDPIGPWGPDGGRVYATALLTLSLLTERRYARIPIR